MLRHETPSRDPAVFPASHGDIYRVRAMDVNTQVDNFDAVIASHGNEAIIEKATSERSRDDEKSRR